MRLKSVENGSVRTGQTAGVAADEMGQFVEVGETRQCLAHVLQ
jgi:hypothetical protein